MIGPRASQLGTLVGLLFLGAIGFGNGPAIVWAVTAGGVLVAMMSAPPPSLIRATLASDRRRPRVGDTVRLRVDVQVQRGLGPVLVRVPLPDAFQLVAGSNVALVWKGPRAVSRRIEVLVRAAKRGPCSIGPVEAHALHPFRLRRSTRSVVTNVMPLAVEPRMRKVARLRHTRGQAVTVQPAGDAARLGARGNDFEEIRGYVAGDPMRSVNWKATARRSYGDTPDLMVNEYAYEGKKSIWLFLDGAAYMEIGSTQENALDHALEGALGILSHFSGRGYRIGATLYHQPETRVLYPDVGSRQLSRLTAELAGLTAYSGGEGLDYAVLRSRSFLLRERPLVLLVTRPEADPARTRAALSRIRAITGHGKRNSPILLFAPTPVAHTLEGGHHRLTAAALRLAARGTYQGLRQQGVRVLDWDPGHMPLERLLMRELVAR